MAIMKSKAVQDTMASCIREARQQSGLSVRQVAEVMGISWQRVEGWENGTGRIDIVDLGVFCTTIGISLSQLIQRLETVLTDQGQQS